MSLVKKVTSSIIDNLENDQKDQINSELIDFLVRKAINNKDKVESEIVPSFQLKLNRIK